MSDVSLLVAEEYLEKDKCEILCVYDRHAGLVDGAKWQKEQMMKSAFPCEIGKSIKEGIAVLCGNFAHEDAGDKVKVIIIKED